MRRTSASISAFARPRRALTATVLAALALAGCGSEHPSEGGAQGKPGSGVAAESSASSDPGQAGFTAMLDKVTRPCTSPAGTGNETGNETETGHRPSDERPTSPAGKGDGKESLVPGETPPAEPVEPGVPTGPAAELNDREWCASVQHEQRVVQALQRVEEPTPTKVRKTLNDLGYIDERIHGLKQDGKITRFYLDLREKGGRLCEEGLAAGMETDMFACVARAAGPFTVTSSGR